MTHQRLVGSPKHLRQILTNLAGNAVKYNRPGGSVTVACRELSCDGERAWYEFRCADTGIGMSEEFQRQMYEPFAQEERDENVTAARPCLGRSWPRLHRAVLEVGLMLARPLLRWAVFEVGWMLGNAPVK